MQEWDDDRILPKRGGNIGHAGTMPEVAFSACHSRGKKDRSGIRISIGPGVISRLHWQEGDCVVLRVSRLRREILFQRVRPGDLGWRLRSSSRSATNGRLYIVSAGNSIPEDVMAIVVNKLIPETAVGVEREWRANEEGLIVSTA